MKTYQSQAVQWMVVHAAIVGILIFSFGGGSSEVLRTAIFTFIIWLSFIWGLPSHDGYGTTHIIAEIANRYSSLPPDKKLTIFKRSWNWKFLYLPKAMAFALLFDMVLMAVIALPLLTSLEIPTEAERVSAAVHLFLIGLFGIAFPRFIFWFRYNLSLRFWRTSPETFRGICDRLKIDPYKRDQVWQECLSANLVIPPEGEPS